MINWSLISICANIAYEYNTSCFIKKLQCYQTKGKKSEGNLSYYWIINLLKRPPSAPHTYYKGRMHWCWIFLQSFPERVRIGNCFGIWAPLRQFVKYKTSVCLSNSYQHFPILYRFVNGGIFWPKCFISQQFSESPFVCDAIMNDRSNFNENLVDNMSKVYYLHQNFLI